MIEFLKDCRKKTIDIEKRKLLISNFHGSDQEKDFTEPANCSGYGRIRHFKLDTSVGWPQNPLPIVPACQALNLPVDSVIRTQLFQISICNWNCWYCYVPKNLRSADKNNSDWLSVSELVDLYLKENNRPSIIVLSGGQPDLVPEWIPWMMSELKSRSMEKMTYLWSDDNLSSDFFYHYLSNKQLDLIKSYKNYGKVGCLKGFDKQSFQFNTNMDSSYYDKQFTLIKKHINLGIDFYAYITLTTPSKRNIRTKIEKFINKLQKINTYLPLRTVPLEIKPFTPTNQKLNRKQELSMKYQNIAIKWWNKELNNIFSTEELKRPISNVKLCSSE